MCTSLITMTSPAPIAFVNFNYKKFSICPLFSLRPNQLTESIKLHCQLSCSYFLSSCTYSHNLPFSSRQMNTNHNRIHHEQCQQLSSNSGFIIFLSLGGPQQAKHSSTTFSEIPLLLGCFFQILANNTI